MLLSCVQISFSLGYNTLQENQCMAFLTGITAPPGTGASKEEERLDPQKMTLLKGFESRWGEKNKKKNRQPLNSPLSSATLAHGLKLPKSQCSSDNESFYDKPQASLSASPSSSWSWSNTLETYKLFLIVPYFPLAARPCCRSWPSGLKS